MDIKNVGESLNIKKKCRVYGLELWQCPHFLFPLMGGIIIIAIIGTYWLAQYYFTEPQVAALIVLLVASFLFVIGHIILAAFERVAESSRTKSEFVAIMSHQLRTPLSTIKWQLDLLKEKKAKAGAPETEKFLEHLEEENQRLIHMVNDLLELNRIEDNALYLVPDDFSLKKVADEIVSRRNKSLAGSNILIEVQSPENLPFVFADEVKIKNVVSHILDNAIRYSPKGGKIAVILENLGKFVRCSVKDEGIGISQEDQKMIFGKFFRAESVYKHQTQGLGLRLYLAKAIVRASAGEIGFKSQENKGSTFWFTLPVCDKINKSNK